MQVCDQCGAQFLARQVILGAERKLHGRKRCPACLPYRMLKGPRVPVPHAPRALTCSSCERAFPAKAFIDGRMRSLYRRRFCLECSPFGMHNTSRLPLPADPEERQRERRDRRRETFRRSLRKRRRLRKELLVQLHGGRCVDCGYSTTLEALDFHHRDASTKDFALGTFGGVWKRVLAEAEKCDLLCASCHRIRHAIEDVAAKGGPVVSYRRRMKVHAVAYMGGACFGCDRAGLPAIFEFHHWDPHEKQFGITQDGVPRRWEKIVAELQKCVMLCANCHREVHAGVRELDEGLLGLAEPTATYTVAAA